VTVEERLAKLEARIEHPGTVYVVVHDLFPVAAYADREEAERHTDALAGRGARCLANACMVEVVLR
jgi:hypothetical protein